MKKILTTLILASILLISNAQDVKIIAHRGAWKNTNTPQNSIASLQEAIKAGYWGSEFDVCLTKDNVLVVNHDYDYQGVDIATTDYSEIRKLKLSNGEPLPTAEEYMREGIKQKKTKMVFEIKPSKLGKERSIKSAELAYKLVKDLKALKNTVFISFSYDVCLKLRELDKNVRIQYLTGDKTPEALFKEGIREIDYNLNALKNNPSYISEAKAKKMKVNVWTVNDKGSMEYFIDKKVDYITTDEPELLKQILK